MEHDLSISIQGFNNADKARELGNITLEVIRHLELKYLLDVSKLKKVIVSFDFPAALQSITKEFNHQAPPTFTNSEQAKAVAQLVSRISHDGQISEYALVLSVDFFIELFDDAGLISLDNISQIIHRMHHELVHVHELNRNSLDNSMLIDDYDNAFLMTSKRAWSEYLANYMSSNTATDDSIRNMLFTLERILIEVPLEIDDLVLKYKHGFLSLSEMHSAVTERIKLIANMYGYAYGYIHGMDIDVETHFPDLFELLSKSPLSISLSALGEALSSIKCKFDDRGISDYDVFNSSIRAIRAIYASFGLQVSRSAEPGMGLYINVY